MASPVHFLTGDVYRFELPELFDPAPDLLSTATLDRARNVTYRPLSRWTPAPEENPQLEHAYDLSDGFTRIAVYRTIPADPETLVAFWKLPDGYLNTFMQDDADCGNDIEAQMRTVVSSLTVRISRFGLPTLTFADPVRAGNAAQPIERDKILYFPRDTNADWPYLTVQREPAWAYEGSGSRTVSGLTTPGSAATATVTTAERVSVTLTGPAEQRDALLTQADEIAASLVKVA